MAENPEENVSIVSFCLVIFEKKTDSGNSGSGGACTHVLCSNIPVMTYTAHKALDCFCCTVPHLTNFIMGITMIS